MASKLVQLQSKAWQASKFVQKYGSDYYKQMMEQNKKYVVDPPTVEKCQELSKQLFYTRLARHNYVEVNAEGQGLSEVTFKDFKSSC